MNERMQLTSRVCRVAVQSRSWRQQTACEHWCCQARQRRHEHSDMRHGLHCLYTHCHTLWHCHIVTLWHCHIVTCVMACTLCTHIVYGLYHRITLSTDHFKLNWTRFLHASAMLKHVIDIGWTSVCPSVCHTLALYQNGWIYCHAFFTTR